MSKLDQRCTNVLGVMTAYLEGHMPDDERTRLETHIVYCPGCYGFLSQLRATAADLRTLPVEPPDAAEREALRTAFREAAGSA
ncbi:MAG TPA: zf-HC2 domain-containing protein [Thermoleophilaceae bacterium]